MRKYIALLITAILLAAGVQSTLSAEIGTVNIAQGKFMAESGNTWNMPGSRMFDGNEGADFCWSSNDTGEVWVAADLGAPYAIGAIEIVGRPDTDQSGNHAGIEIHASEFSDFRTYDVIAETGEEGFPFRETFRGEVDSNKTYQYVRLWRGSYLCMAEFKVYEKILSADEMAAINIAYEDIDEALNNKLNVIGIAGAVFETGDPLVFGGDTEITRAEFAVLVHDIMGFGSYSAASSYFTDTAETAGREKIEALRELGIVSGYMGSIFKPDAVISAADAAVLAAKALGYNKIAEYAENPYAVLVAKVGELGLAKNAGSGNLTRYGAANILYNMLDAKIAEIKTVGGTTFATDKTLLENKDIYKATGIYQESYKRSIINVVPKVKESIVIVGGEEFEVLEVPDNYYLGMNVEFYYKHNAKEGTNRLLYMTEKPGQEVVETGARNITGYSNYRITYKDESGKTKYIRFTNASNVIYNGRLITDFKDEYFNPAEGYIRAVDRDGNGTCEYLEIFSYYNAIAQRINSADGIIYLEGSGGMIDLDDGNRTIAVYYMGTETAIKSIKANTVLSIGESTDGNHYEVYVGAGGEEVKLTSLTEDTMTVDYLDTYERSNSFIEPETLLLGKRGLMYRDYEGRAVKFDTEDYATYRYGFLTGVELMDGISNEADIAVYTQMGSEEIFKVGDSIKLDGRVYRDKAEFVNTLKSRAQNERGKIEDYLIKYRANISLEITELDTLTTDAGGEDDEFENTLPLRDMYYMNGIWEGKYTVNSNTVVLVTYGSGEDAEDRYSVSSTGRWSNQHHYEFEGYDGAADKPFGLVLIRGSKGDDLDFNAPCILVTGLGRAISRDENEVTAIKGMYNGSEGTFSLYDEKLIVGLEEHISKGDILRVELNQYSEIIKLSLAFDHDAKTGSPAVTTPTKTNSGGNVMTQFYVMYGGVYDVNDDFVILKPDGQMDSETEYSTFTRGFGGIYIYNKETGKARKGTLGDVVSYKNSTTGYSKVFVRTNGGYQRELVIYEE